MMTDELRQAYEQGRKTSAAVVALIGAILAKDEKP